MFVNCPYCRFLVALDSQGLPLPRCPNCARHLRDDVPAASSAPASQDVAAAAAEPPRPADGATADGPGAPAALEPRYDDDHGIEAPLALPKAGVLPAGSVGDDTPPLPLHAAAHAGSAAPADAARDAASADAHAPAAPAAPAPDTTDHAVARTTGGAGPMPGSPAADPSRDGDQRTDDRHAKAPVAASAGGPPVAASEADEAAGTAPPAQRDRGERLPGAGSGDATRTGADDAPAIAASATDANSIIVSPVDDGALPDADTWETASAGEAATHADGTVESIVAAGDAASTAATATQEDTPGVAAPAGATPRSDPLPSAEPSPAAPTPRPALSTIFLRPAAAVAAPPTRTAAADASAATTRTPSDARSAPADHGGSVTTPLPEPPHGRTDEPGDAGARDRRAPADPGHARAAAADGRASVEANATDLVPLGPLEAESVQRLPAFARPVRRRSAADLRRRRLEIGAAAALALLLPLQLLLSQRAALAADARWRPLVSALCGALHCSVPAWREADAFHVVQRDVRAQSPGVLRVNARFRNDARWPQPWPRLQLTFSDANGRAVATRTFQPREYLGGAPSQPLIGSGQTAVLAMRIAEPGERAVAFTFEFH